MQGITITYNGLTLGDGSNYYISFLDPGRLEMRQASQLASGRDGGFIFNQNYGMRNIQLDVNIFSSTDAEFFEDIRELRTTFARTNTPKELTINYWDGSVRKVNVFPFTLPNPVHRPGNTDKSDFSVVLQAAWPFYTDNNSLSTTLYLTLPEGFDYPFDYPFDYEAGTATNTYIFNNDGEVDALVSITFNGTVINPTLLNSSTGQYIQLETTLGSSTSVTLEYTNEGRSIENQSGASFEQYFVGSTAFFFVPPGSNTFIFSASTYDASASCNLSFKKYYLS